MIQDFDSKTKVSYLEVLQVGWHSVGADLVPFDNIASLLVVATHCTSAITLVKAAANVLRCQFKMAVSTDRKSLRRSHGCGCVGAIGS